jgi:hypothetical protein
MSEKRISETNKSWLLVALIIVAFLTGWPGRSEAECVSRWNDLTDAKNLATVVFTGTPYRRFRETWTFRVDRTLKGPRLPVLDIYVYPDIENLSIQQGLKYLVFADPIGDQQRSEWFGDVRFPRQTFVIYPCGATRVMVKGESLKGLGISLVNRSPFFFSFRPVQQSAIVEPIL